MAMEQMERPRYLYITDYLRKHGRARVVDIVRATGCDRRIVMQVLAEFCASGKVQRLTYRDGVPRYWLTDSEVIEERQA